MQYVEYGGTLKYGDLLGGFLKYGDLGSIPRVGEPDIALLKIHSSIFISPIDRHERARSEVGKPKSARGIKGPGGARSPRKI